MNKKKVTGWVLGVAVVLFLMTLPGCLSSILSSEVTVYPVETSSKKGGAVALDRIVFTVFPERQEVVCTVLGEKKRMMRWQKCIVRNKENWTCTDSFSERIMADGDYSESPSYSISYTNGWKWWFLRFNNYLSIPMPEWVGWLCGILVGVGLIAFTVYVTLFPFGYDKNRRIWSGKVKNLNLPTKTPYGFYRRKSDRD